jgi:two-component system, sensor histidine kinase
MYGYADPIGRYAILLIAAAMGMGGIYSMAPRWRTFAAFVSGITAPMVLAMLLFGRSGGGVLVALSLFYWGFTVLAARTLSHTLVTSLRLRYENAELISELAAQRDAARTADSAKTRFLAAASHDLRQPLNALSLYLHTLRNEPLSEQAQRVVDQAQRSSVSLASMFNGMMDAFRLEHGDIEPQWAQTRVWPLLERLHDELLPLAQQRGLELRLLGARDAQAWLVRWDEGLVERMVRNLVDNALRHTEAGGVALVLRRRGGAVRLQVLDTGLGMDESSLAYLMRPYDRVQTRRGPVSSRGGTGLGLAIVEHIARLCDVPWGVRSRLGRGTAVSMELPWVGIAAVPAEPSPAIGRGALAGVPWVGVAEDDPASLDALTQVLAKRGWLVVQARDARTFRDAVLARSSPPFALLSDWRLGTDDGLALLEVLRDEYIEPPNCVLFSGEWSRNLELACERAGVHYLPKPILPSALIRVMELPPRNADADSSADDALAQAAPSAPVRA